MPRPLLQAALAAFALLTTACATGRLQAPRGLPLQLVRQAVTHALTGDGFRGIRHAGEQPETASPWTIPPGSIEVTKGHRPSTAMTLGGVDAVVEYTEANGRIDLAIECSSSFTLVPLGDACAALVRKMRQQLALAHGDMLAAGKPKSAEVAQPPTPIERTPFSGRRWVLIVGVSEHSDDNWSTLRGARADAEALKKLLQEHPRMSVRSSSDITMFVGEDATEANIMAKLRAICELAAKGDMILVYFACHAESPTRASDKRYLVTHDTELDKLEDTSIPRDRVLALLDSSQAERQMLFLDCCFGGRGTVRRGSNEVDPFLSLGAKPRNPSIQRAAITSTQGDQFALDLMPGSSHSPFAHFVLRELQRDDPDGALTAGELQQRIREGVTSVGRTQGNLMNPQVYGDASLELWRVSK